MLNNLKISFVKGLIIIAIFACVISFIMIKLITKVSNITCNYDADCANYNYNR